MPFSGMKLTSPVRFLEYRRRVVTIRRLDGSPESVKVRPLLIEISSNGLLQVPLVSIFFSTNRCTIGVFSYLNPLYFPVSIYPCIKASAPVEMGSGSQRACLHVIRGDVDVFHPVSVPFFIPVEKVVLALFSQQLLDGRFLVRKYAVDTICFVGFICIGAES